VLLAAVFGETLGAALVLDIRLHPRERIDWLEAQREACVVLRDKKREGAALGNLGIAWRTLGEPWRAIEFYEQHLGIAREIGDRRGEGSALFNAGLALDALGKRDDAVRRVREALAIVEAIGAEHHAATVRAQLAEWGAEDGRS
jgi:tetratricopeptide (TPR) repeat protein